MVNTIHKGMEILRTPAQEVKFPLTKKDLEFIDQLYAEVKTFAISPFGLAANQIAKDTNYIPSMFLAMFDFKLAKKEDEENEPVYQLFINPKIELSGGSIKNEEGCLSIPKVTKKVRRKRNVTITYNDVDGDEHSVKIFGDANFISYIIQHEVDHLNGKLITDKKIITSSVGL